MSTAAKTHQPRSELRDGMHIDWDVEIAMDDGLVLKADVFRPAREGRYPVILSYGPYAKAMAAGLAMQDTAAVCAVLEKQAGVKRARSKRNKR